MKINLGYGILNLYGGPYVDVNGKPLTLRDIFCTALSNYQTGDIKQASNLYALGRRIAACEGELSVTSEEGSDLKKCVVAAYPVGVSGQVSAIVDGTELPALPSPSKAIQTNGKAALQ